MHKPNKTKGARRKEFYSQHSTKTNGAPDGDLEFDLQHKLKITLVTLNKNAFFNAEFPI